MRIVTLDGFTLGGEENPLNAIAELGELTVHDRTSEQQIIPRATDAEILLTNKTPLTRQSLEQLPNLKFISVLATGFNIVDVGAARELGIPVSNAPFYSTDSVAQHVFALLLSLMHRPKDHDSAIRRGEWTACQDFSFWLTPYHVLAGQTMGIVGFGRIGFQVGKLADAFGMKVIAYNPSKKSEPDFDNFQWTSLEELFERSDVISLNCPQTKENTEFVNKDLLSRMKPNSILVNASRGGLICEADLADALQNGQTRGAALDVVSVEPIRDDNPLLNAPNCLLTPHMAWAGVEARQRLVAITADNIRAFLNGHPQNVVNERQ